MQFEKTFLKLWVLKFLSDCWDAHDLKKKCMHVFQGGKHWLSLLKPSLKWLMCFKMNDDGLTDQFSQLFDVQHYSRCGLLQLPSLDLHHRGLLSPALKLSLGSKQSHLFIRPHYNRLEMVKSSV